MRYLITGGAGFIGSHLAEALLAAGHDALVVDDLSTGAIANIEPLKRHARFRYHIETCANVPFLAECVDWADAIFHLAAAVGVELIVSSPVRTIETNVYLTELLLKQAAKKKKRVLLASTSEVYGKASKVPFREDDDLVLGPPTKGRWAYACSKLLDEFLGLAYGKEKGVPVTVARLFNTVGPRQTGRYGMVLPSFAAQALRNEPITVFGTGEQSRCFGHVRDVVQAMMKLIATPAAVGQVFNIGSDREVTINQLAEMVRAAAGSRSEIRRVPYAEAYAEGFEDMQRRIPDCRKLEKTIGMRPSTSLETIIADVVADQRAQLGSA